MQRRTLGSTGVQVSAIGLGGYHIGKIPDRTEAIRLIRAAIDSGITFLDNSWDYHNGESERRMGDALRDGYRQRVYLMTKLDGQTREAAAAQLEQSLERLQTDMIDLVQMHEIIRPEDPQRICGEGGALEALVEAQQAGKLRHIGFTGHKDPSIHRLMLEQAYAWASVQMPLNLLDAHFRSFESEVLPILKQRTIAALGMKPLASAQLLKTGVTADECLRYALSLDTSVVITGCESMQQLEQALRAGRDFTPLSSEERADLLRRTAAAAASGADERYKTTTQHDATTHNPQWLTSAAA